MKASTERIYRDVEFLTSLFPSRSFQNIESLEKASGYIKEEFEKIGAKSETQTWIAQGNEYKNIITSYNTEKTRSFRTPDLALN
jgi:hypothetical protein